MGTGGVCIIGRAPRFPEHHLLLLQNMAGEVFYADLKFSDFGPPSQHRKPPSCPRWHRAALALGWAWNVILAGAVIVLGVWVFQGNTQKEQAEDSSSLEEFQSYLGNQPCSSPQKNITGPPASPCLITPKSPVRVAAGHTALLPFYIHTPTPSWTLVSIRWVFAPGNRPILVYELVNCSGTASPWWARPCKCSVEVTGSYQPRVELSFPNATLRIRGVQASDAGSYRVTVQFSDVPPATGEVNLTVT